MFKKQYLPIIFLLGLSVILNSCSLFTENEDDDSRYEDPVDVSHVVGGIGGMDDYIVDIYLHNVILQPLQYLFHHSLEGCRGVLEPHRHYLPLPQPFARAKRRLLGILR